MSIVMKNIILLNVFIFFFYSCISDNVKSKEELKMKLLEEANSYYNQNYYKKALHLYNQILRIDTTIPSVYFNKGVCIAYSENKATMEEIKCYEKSIQLGYRKDDANFNIGKAYWGMHQDSLALVFYAKAIKENPKHQRAIEEYEFLEWRIKQFKEYEDN